MSKNVAVILAAAGSSTRFGDPNFKKVYALLAGRAVWLHSADIFLEHPRVGQVIVVVHPDDREMFKEKYSCRDRYDGDSDSPREERTMAKCPECP